MKSLVAALLFVFAIAQAQVYFTSPYALLLQQTQSLFKPRPSSPAPASIYTPPPKYTSNAVAAPAQVVGNAIDNEHGDDDDMLLFGAPEDHSHSHFDYNGDSWMKHFPQCGGKRQSPIDIDSSKFKETSFNSPLQWINYWEPAESMNLENNGHSMEIDGVWKKGTEPTITGGPLNGEYVFKQLHFHWGRNDSSGSEHTINGKAHPMEMHAVHWKKSYGTYEKAIQNADGLAVVGYFWKVVDSPNFMLESFIQHLPKIAGSKTKEIELPQIFPLEVLGLSFSKNYVTYDGSLTTPPCSEIVTWIVSAKPLTLSRSQMQRMRTTVKNDNADIHNYRPVQDLNDRSLQFVR